jgi:hypothetical protein
MGDLTIRVWDRSLHSDEPKRWKNMNDSKEPSTPWGVARSWDLGAGAMDFAKFWDLDEDPSLPTKH